MSSKIKRMLCGLLIVAGSTLFADISAPLPKVGNRAAWKKVESHPAWKSILVLAEEQRVKKLEDPFPYYLDFRKNGDRQSYQSRLNVIQGFGPLAVAYCVTRDKKWLTPIEKRIQMLIDLPTWVLPSHYVPVNCHTGKTDVIDIEAASIAAELSLLLNILGEDLDKNLAERLKQDLIRRIVIPWEELIDGNHYMYDWMERNDNWNAVCIGGCARAFLMLDIAPERKERLLKYAMQKLENYMIGFGTDSYCSEGISYWYYGFGHFLQLTECIQRYNGKNLFDVFPGAKPAAAFPEKILIVPGCYPAYADTAANVRNPYYLEFRDILLGKRKGFTSQYNFRKNKRFSILVSILFVPVDEKPLDEINPEKNTVFSQAQVYVARGSADCHMGVSFKGGSNREFHNHNDVGSYVIAMDDVPVVLDPGTEIYTARTFGDRRYESRLIGSYGHSVPRIDGKEQTHLDGKPPVGFSGRNIHPASATAAKILKQTASEKGLSVTMDYKAAYNYIPGITRLERCFDFDRIGKGRFTVVDTAEFDREMPFEGAVIIEGTVEELGNQKYLIKFKGKAVVLEVFSSVPIKCSVDMILEKTSGNRTFRRMSFKTVKNCRNVKMEFKYTPAQ